MKTLLRISLPLMLLCAMAAGCHPGNTSMSSFLSDETVRLELDGEKVFVFNESTCQLSYNEDRCRFRAHSDTMLYFFVVELDRIPLSAGGEVTANISWNTTYGERYRNNITLNVQRIKGDIIWLCDATQHTAVVVRTLK